MSTENSSTSDINDENSSELTPRTSTHDSGDASFPAEGEWKPTEVPIIVPETAGSLITLVDSRETTGSNVFTPLTSGTTSNVPPAESPIERHPVNPSFSQSSFSGRHVAKLTASSTTITSGRRRNVRSFRLDIIPPRVNEIDPVGQFISTIPRQTTTFVHNGTTVPITVHQLNTLKEIGSGQFGKVYHVEIEEPIPLSMAVKRIPITSKAENFRSIYLELTALEKIRSCPSPHVVDFYCALIDPNNGELCICMSYMTTTAEMFYRTMHQLEQIQSSDVYTFVRRCAHDLITGLKYLKDRGIVHRDVKPTNLLMDSNGQIKLCDFGISGRLDPTEPDFVVNVGTTHYLPPKPDKCSIRNDIWAAGMSLLEIAKGEHPLTTIHSDSVQFRLNHWKVPSMEEIDEDIRRLISRLFGFEQRSESRPDSYEDIIRETFIGTMSENRSSNESVMNEYVLERVLPFGIPDSESQCSTEKIV